MISSQLSRTTPYYVTDLFRLQGHTPPWARPCRPHSISLSLTRPPDPPEGQYHTLSPPNLYYSYNVTYWGVSVWWHGPMTGPLAFVLPYKSDDNNVRLRYYRPVDLGYCIITLTS